MKKILITGASHGLGLALLKKYDQQKVKLIAIDKHIDEDLRTRHPEVHFKLIDITKKKDIKDFIRLLNIENFLPDVVIFNAAVHVIDCDPYLNYEKFTECLEINMLSILYFLACFMPVQKRPTTFVFCSSGVIIFPNPSSLGYYLSKLGVTKIFDYFSDRYFFKGFTFKSVILGPLNTPMLHNSKEPKGFVKILRDLTTGNIDIAAEKIIEFIESPKRRMYFLRLSACILWAARIVQFLLPKKFKFYKVL